MVFSSMFFLFLFLVVTLAAYFLVPERHRRARNLVLLATSLFFYFFGEPVGILLMLASIVGNYFFARFLAAGRHAKGWLVLSVVFNLAMLGTFKYADFFVVNFNALTGLSLPVPGLAMPIGISFFTFQGMSYVFDVYARRVPAQRDIVNVATYISMFPQLVAGPIVRYETVAAELETRHESLPRAADGARRFIYGLAKKMLLSNAMGEIATAVFAADPADLAAPVAWVGALAYTFQIFFDFSGYSDMAIGLGHIFGFTFLENFNYPYISRSITEFWRRWHMSLSTWFRDYVYIPLGGSRRGLARQILNILIVWTLTGLWHGAAWNFVVWGLYFALILSFEKLFLLKALERTPRVIQHVYALTLVVLGWVLFNSSSLSHAAGYLAALFRAPDKAYDTGQALYYLLEYLPEWGCCILFSLPIGPWFRRRWETRAWYAPAVTAAAAILFLLSLLWVVSSSFNPFIYFRF